MFAVEKITGSKTEIYEELARQTSGLLQGERDLVANAANVAALIWQIVPELNWAGFYFLKGGELVLGPFQGKPACVRIPVGRGVCGTAVLRAQSMLVCDVHEFPGHIACDAASNAELVVPFSSGGVVRGVIDLDSPLKARFDEVDQRGVEAIVALYAAGSDF